MLILVHAYPKMCCQIQLRMCAHGWLLRLSTRGMSTVCNFHHSIKCQGGGTMSAEDKDFHKLHPENLTGVKLETDAVLCCCRATRNHQHLEQCIPGAGCLSLYVPGVFNHATVSHLKLTMSIAAAHARVQTGCVKSQGLLETPEQNCYLGACFDFAKLLACTSGSQCVAAQGVGSPGLVNTRSPCLLHLPNCVRPTQSLGSPEGKY